MRFLFVDSITERGSNFIKGTRHFPLGEPLRYPATAAGDGQVAPGALSEAIGQLASWLCLEKNDFAARPVFLFAEAITALGQVPIGRTVDLRAVVSQLDAETFTFSGEALLDGRIVQRIVNCSGYFMPLQELEDPAETRRRFEALVNGGLKLGNAEGPAFDFDSLAGVSTKEGDAAVSTKTLAPDEPFYADHFPRFPVTPIVILNEMIGAVAKCALSNHSVKIAEVRDVKIKSFVKPGESCVTRVTVQKIEGGRAHTIAEISKNGRRILRGAYVFELGART